MVLYITLSELGIFRRFKVIAIKALSELCHKSKYENMKYINLTQCGT
jgi:hypothetical protein